MAFSQFSIIALIVANLILAIGIFARDRKGKENSYFALFVVLVDIWIGTNYLENAPDAVGFEYTGMFLRLDFAFAMLALFVWAYFCDIFSRVRVPASIHKILRTGGLAFSVIFSLLSLFSPYIITHIRFERGIIGFSRGPLWNAYAILLFVFAVTGVVYLFLGKRRAIAEQRLVAAQQLNFIILGFLISVGTAIIINILQAFVDISLDISRVGIFGIFILVALTGYAVARHRLFDIRLMLVRTVSFFAFMAVFAAAYALLFMSLAQTLVGQKMSLSLFLIFLFLTMAASLTFRPIDNSIRRATNRIFFKERYDSENLLAALTRIMADEAQLGPLCEKLLQKLLQAMHIERGALLIRDKSLPVRAIALGYDEEALLGPDMQQLFQYKSYEYGFISDQMDDMKIKDFLQGLDISIFIPIRAGKTDVAVLILGPKSSGDAYFDNDIAFLHLFASETGIAIQNAFAYENTIRMNQQLEERVAERTKELKETQRQELEKAREVARLKDEFVFLAAHELRTPITAIRGFLELVRGEKDFPQKTRENIENISEASDQLTRLINDLLEVAKSERGRLAMQMSARSLAAPLREGVREVSAMAKKKGVRVKVRMEPRLAALCDPEKVKEVAVNLLSNAIKYNRPKGTVALTAKRDTRAGVARITIEDTGYGIPDADKPRIFEKFYRVITKETREITGTGLGLFICRMLVSKMGGTISFSSIEGKGSSFSFTLPLPRYQQKAPQ